MSLTSSDSMTALHKIIENKCSKAWISSYSNRPRQIFDEACIRTSIVTLLKTGQKDEESLYQQDDKKEVR